MVESLKGGNYSEFQIRMFQIKNEANKLIDTFKTNFETETMKKKDLVLNHVNNQYDDFIRNLKQYVDTNTNNTLVAHNRLNNDLPQNVTIKHQIPDNINKRLEYGDQSIKIKEMETSVKSIPGKFNDILTFLKIPHKLKETKLYTDEDIDLLIKYQKQIKEHIEELEESLNTDDIKDCVNHLITGYLNHDEPFSKISISPVSLKSIKLTDIPTSEINKNIIDDIKLINDNRKNLDITGLPKNKQIILLLKNELNESLYNHIKYKEIKKN